MSRPLASLLTATALMLAATCGGERPQSSPGALPVADLMGRSAATGYRRALEVRDFSFPDDHGPHEDFRTEWWYFTGHLASSSGHRFGYQLTFFRNGVAPAAPRRASAWGAHQIYMAHLALTDVDGNRFRSYERFARAALGLAGAEGSPFRVWLEDWQVEAADGGGMRLVAKVSSEVSLELDLLPGKCPVLHGDAGFSRKGSQDGNASYYYSLTRMPTWGRVEMDGTEFEVSGESWMDREWSTSALEEGQVGWDWFSLQLNDGRELMLYRIRRADDAADPHSAGTLISGTGDYRPIAADGWQLEVLESWASPETGIRYPAGWRLTVPAEQLALEVRPVVADQELRHTFRYWEGVAEVTGSSRGEAIAGRGYVELTGYE